LEVDELGRANMAGTGKAREEVRSFSVVETTEFEGSDIMNGGFLGTWEGFGWTKMARLIL
jgi:hypothetical protein